MRPAAGRRAGRAHLAPLLLLAATLVMLGAPSASALPTQPSCTLELDTHQVTAAPSSTAADLLVITGSVNVSLGSFSGARTLMLTSSISQGDWAATVAPESQDFTDSARVPFNATVTVPPAELASRTGQLTVSASFLAVQGVPSSVVRCSDNAAVNVKQYYGVAADTSTSHVTVTTGPTGVEATLIVRNSGNGRDSFTIDLDDRLGMEDVGITTNLPITNLALDPNEERNVSFHVNTTSVAQPDNYPMVVTVHSEKEPLIAATAVSITVIVKSGGIIPELPGPTTLLIIGAVAAAGVGVLIMRRRQKRDRAVREVRRRLQKVVQRREQGESAGEGSVPLPPEAPAAEAPAEPQPRVRVRVKAPPNP